MVGDVALGAARGIVLMQASLDESQTFAQAGQSRPGRIVEIAKQNLEEIVDRALLDEEGAVHIGFADCERGVEEQPPLRASIGDAGDYGLAAAVAKRVGDTIGVDQAQIS